MEAALLALALTWPSACVAIGDLYHHAATLRDTGRTLEQVLKLTDDSRIKRTLIHVYERKDMTPDEWRWFAIGACVGDNRGVAT